MSIPAIRLRFVAGPIAMLTLGGLVFTPALAARPSPGTGPLGRYIVTLDSSVADPAGAAHRQSGRLGGNVDRVFGNAFKGYTTSLPEALVSKLLADPSILAIEPDVQVNVAAAQGNPPYGLDRIDQRNLPLSRSYAYATAGAGVRAYVIDTGTRREHPDFGNRVAPGYNVFDGTTNASDCNGHGTHVAGIVASSTYGVAKAATIVPVKTFGCSGTTPLSAIIAGIDWATADHRPGQRAVANLSVGGTPSAALDRSITALSNDGVAVAVAAGNDGLNACAGSPARVPQVLTVAASDAADGMAGFSSGGPCVDLFAPGVGIVSTDSRSNGSVVMSGTSMASPFVTGALAREMGVAGTTAQRAQSLVLAKATLGHIRGTEQRCIRTGCRPATGANRLLFA